MGEVLEKWFLKWGFAERVCGGVSLWNECVRMRFF
jgi:hypothetical protein